MARDTHTYEDGEHVPPAQTQSDYARSLGIDFDPKTISRSELRALIFDKKLSNGGITEGAQFEIYSRSKLRIGRVEKIHRHSQIITFVLDDGVLRATRDIDEVLKLKPVTAGE